MFKKPDGLYDPTHSCGTVETAASWVQDLKCRKRRNRMYRYLVLPAWVISALVASARHLEAFTQYMPMLSSDVPGAVVDFACLVLFAVSSTSHYRLHNSDENQDYYLICGITLSVALGKFAGISLESCTGGVLPFGIMLSLILSSFVHSSALVTVPGCLSNI